MATRIKLKRSTVAATVPTTSNLEDGEVALNIADKKLYARNGSNIIEVANQKPNTGEVTTTMLSTDFTNGQGNTFYVATVGSDNTTLANGGAGGKHPDTPFLTITKALSTATSGDTIIVAPGEYQEAFPMTVGDGVTLRGTNLRSTSVKPTSVTNSNTAFILSGDCHISDLTIKDFFYDSSNDDGYAFEVVSNMNSTQSPYIERCTVNTKGSVVSGSDPYGYTQGDAGRGAKLDGANIASASQHGSVLFNECTFITPNQVGLKVTNGMRVEWLNCFNYFASIGIQGVQGATGKSGSGSTRLKLGGTSGTFSTSEVAYQLENSFQSGTYARSGATVTLTRTAHGLITGDYIYADHINGGATDGFYQVTKVDDDNVTYSSGSGTISSSLVTYKKAVGRGVVASNDGTYVFITGKGTGEFVTVNKAAKVTSRFGDSQLDTAQKKFGTASILLDGTEDNVKVPTDDDFGFGTANFCLEAFIRPNSVTGIQRIFDLRESTTNTAPTVYLNGTALHFASGNTSHINGGTLSTGTWYHVAVARNAGTTKLFLDGTELGTYTDANDYGRTKPVIIGSDFQASPTEAFNGHIDEVRVSKAAARFTAGFTPTTTEYGSDLNTVLLLHANGTDASTTFTDASGGISDIRSSGGDSATSVITADYSAFGAEVRSVASACVYGTKGVQADGSGVKLILTSHNFGYVGAGADFTNDPSLAVQNNEVEELNSGKVLFSSTDHLGDFRVGDALTVDVSTGSVNFAATSTAQSAANITLSDSTGTTNIFPAYIETGNLRIAGNSLTSTTGQVIVDPSGAEDFVVNAETIVKEAIYFDVNKSISFGSTVQGALKIGGFQGSTVFGSSEASNFSTRSFVVLKNSIGSVNITGAGTGYVGGQQPVEVITEPFQKATATAVLETTGSIKSITMTNRGEGYTATPTVGFSTGTGAGTAQLASGGRVESFDIQTGGAGYTSPTIAIDPAPQSAFSASSTTVSTTADTVTISGHPFETGDQVLYDATTLDGAAVAIGGLTTATNYYVIRVDDDTIKLASSLSNANAGTALPLSTVGSGSQFFKGEDAVAGAVTVSAGAITAIAITNKGSGYNAAPSVTITDAGASSAAQVVANFGRGVSSVTIDTAGSYTTAGAPTISFTRDASDTTGINAAGDPVIGFPIASISVGGNGLGYRNLPTVSLSGNPTTPAVITPLLDEQTGRLTSLTLASAGVGYETAPTINITGGGGQNATITVDIQSLTGSITASGSGYTAGTYPNVAFTTTGNGQSATATFTILGFQGSITAAGSGYTNSSTDSPYSVTFRNPATTTYTITVASRTKLEYSGIANGPFQVGDVITTNGAGGGTGTVTIVTTTYLYLNNVTGTFTSGQVETITGGTSNATATLDTYTATVNRFLVNGVEGQSITLIDDNTYRLDTSDSTNANHPIAIGDPLNGFLGRQYGTAGAAGSYYEFIVGPSVSTLSQTSYINCTNHGQTMIEPGVINFTTGTAGQSGDGMTGNVTVVGGQVTAVALTAQGQNVKLNDVLVADDADLGGGGGSGFQFTIQSNSTGISSVTAISLTGQDYSIGDVLSIDDATVGGGGGSGFQYTVSNVGFATATAIAAGGEAYELQDTLILGDVGGVGVAQGTGLTLSIATLNPTKSLELTQSGDLTLGAAGEAQLALKPDGSITATSFSVNSTGLGSFSGLNTTANISCSGTLTVQQTSTFTGLGTFNGGITVANADSSIDRAAIKLQDGSAATPSLGFTNADSPTTGLFRQAANVIGISIAGTEKIRLDATNSLDTTGLQVHSTLGSSTPFFKVDTTTPKLNIGTSTANLSINNSTTIVTEGTDIDVPLTFDTKGGGDFTFKGGANVDLIVDDGTTEVFKLETSTGTATFSGNLDAGKLRLRQNVVANNSTLATRAFGEVLAVNVTGTGSGYTDGTYTATATTSTGGGTGCTVTVTVASGTFSAVTIVDKGQNYAVGDTLVITAAGGGSGISITITDIDGQGVVLKPTAGSSVLVDTTGSLVIPSGTTNERPTTLDRITGAIRFNTSQLQFEGFNGNDFVSLGGVRDVDQDTYILTESAPAADEDTFEFYNQGFNSLSIDKDRFTLKTTRIIDVNGVLNINGTIIGQDTVDFKASDASIAKVRSQKDLEITGGLRLRNVGVQGTIASIGTVTSSSGVYTASTTFNAVASTSTIEGTGATFNVVIDGSGNVSSVAIASGGTAYEVDETIIINGGDLGGASPANDVSFKVATISSTSPAFARLDVLQQDYVTQMDSKAFLSFDSNGSEAAWKINRGWNGGTTSYLTVFDSTATFMELDDCRVEGGQLSSFPTSASIVQFDKTAYKGGKTLVTIESDDNKVHMLEVTTVCASNGTTAHATVTNSVTSDNDLVDATISVVGSNVTISLAKSSAASSSSNFTGRFTTTKVKA